MSMPRLMASKTMPRSWTESSPLAGAIPKMNTSGTCPNESTACARSEHIGIPRGVSPSTSPASSPVFSLSMTATIRYFWECRTRPFAVLPSISPKLASQ